MSSTNFQASFLSADVLETGDLSLLRSTEVSHIEILGREKVEAATGSLRSLSSYLWKHFRLPARVGPYQWTGLPNDPGRTTEPRTKAYELRFHRWPPEDFLNSSFPELERRNSRRLRLELLVSMNRKCPILRRLSQRRSNSEGAHLPDPPLSDVYSAI